MAVSTYTSLALYHYQALLQQHTDYLITIRQWFKSAVDRSTTSGCDGANSIERAGYTLLKAVHTAGKACFYRYVVFIYHARRKEPECDTSMYSSLLKPWFFTNLRGRRRWRCFEDDNIDYSEFSLIYKAWCFPTRHAANASCMFLTIQMTKLAHH